VENLVMDISASAYVINKKRREHQAHLLMDVWCCPCGDLIKSLANSRAASACISLYSSHRDRLKNVWYTWRCFASCLPYRMNVNT
jgi:hypothetical protein